MAVNSSTRVTNLNADQLDGKHQSAFADVNESGGQTAVHVFGPLPVDRTFASDGGTLVVLASGSAFRSSGVADGPGRIAMNVRVDGGTRGRADGFADERGPTRLWSTSSPWSRACPPRKGGRGRRPSSKPIVLHD
jgi:hypothetical protein